ncbi:MAG: copper chaperone PCu(A)C [Spirochaetaceae bacterium]|nr:MAG: copper chaperone PCu(A)C [Spirochaetaceae bacterium]
MSLRFLTACSVFVLLAATAFAGGRGEQEPFRVQDAWARETAGIPRNGAAYLRLSNNTDTDDVLIGGQSTAAEVIEIHTHERNGDVMVMRPLHDGLPVPAGETVVLEPMGIHVMLIGLNHALEAGQRFELELHFESGARVKTEVEVRPLRN